MNDTVRCADGRVRCAWCATAPEFPAYHDDEWGFPVTDDDRLFEKLALEGFQSGLSWRTILVKRPAFRRAFAGFSIDAVARFTSADLRRLCRDPGIVRHQGKIQAVIANARLARDLIDRHGSFAAYVWSFEPPRLRRPYDAAGQSAAALLSHDLKQQGWRFVGPTTTYAFMQAMGLVNDHAMACPTRAVVMRARKACSVRAR